jgi:hypothetical protein
MTRRVGPVRSPVRTTLRAAVRQAVRRLAYSPGELFGLSEVGVHYDPSDLSTLFQDSAGTTPVTASGQPVGLMLDRRVLSGRGVVNLLTWSEAFNDVSWTKTAGVSVAVNTITAPDGSLTADKLTPSTGGGFVELFKNTAVTSGVVYTGSYYVAQNGLRYVQIVSPGIVFGTFYVNFDLQTGSVSSFAAGTSVSLSFDIQPAQNGFWRIAVSAQALVNDAAGRFAVNFIKTATTTRGADEGAFDGVSALNVWGAQFELGSTATAYQRNDSTVGGPGNHASQPTAGQRPLYRRGDHRGVVNLLTWSQDTTQSGWIFTNASGGASRTGNSFTFGASGVDRITQGAKTVSADTYTASVELSGSGSVRLYILDGTGATGTPLVVTLSATKTRYTLTRALTAGTSGGIGVYNNFEATPGATFTIHSAQLELGSTATPYQRNDSHLGGVATGASTDLHWLETDGVDDGMVTGSIDFTSTDKVSVFAGLRKLSDAASGVVCELSASDASFNGSFRLSAPASSGGQKFLFVSKGSFGVGVDTTSSTWNAPVSAVLSCNGDIAADAAVLRVNGTVLSSSSADQGTGNYGNYPLYLFRRGGTLLPFNGHFYGLVITGRLTTDAETGATERYLAGKSGVTL